MAEILPYLQKMAARLEDPALQASLKGYTGSLHFKFTDTGEDYVLQITDGTSAAIVREVPEKPTLALSLTSDLLADIIDKKINAMAAYMQRKVQVNGAMEDLIKLQKLLL